jgi:hypothetical protein
MLSNSRLLLLVIVAFCLPVKGQDVFEHVANKSIYSFLNEMANERIIELNSAVKPYSRNFIAQFLSIVKDSVSQLNSRQQKELGFYLKDFNKELLPDNKFKKRFDFFYYKDSLFTFSINPILGFQYWSNENGSNYHRWNGLDVYAYVGKHFGIYASLRDNHEEKKLAGLDYLDTYPGAVYKSNTDYSEMRGGMTWAWKWGMLGLVKDHLEWGNNYHYPSILSAKAPSFTQLKLRLSPVKWFEFNYIHAWLISGVVDSSRSYYYTNSYGKDYRRIYQKKFMAANIFSFKPIRGLYTSIGNSIIYSDVNAHPAYLIPFFLYKSVDHANNNATDNNGGQNSQFFIDISSRQIKHLHLYATLFFDDVSTARLKENGHLDYYSLNAGFQVSDLIPNTFLTLEFFQSYPLVYKHNMPVTTYESNFYNMGHYLQDNSRGLYTEVAVRPLRGLEAKVFYNHAIHGKDHEELGTDRVEVVDMFLDSIVWKNISAGIEINYQIINDVYVFGSYTYQHNTGEIEKYTAPYFQGKTNTFSIGINYGF